MKKRSTQFMRLRVVANQLINKAMELIRIIILEILRNKFNPVHGKCQVRSINLFQKVQQKLKSSVSVLTMYQ